MTEIISPIFFPIRAGKYDSEIGKQSKKYSEIPQSDSWAVHKLGCGSAAWTRSWMPLKEARSEKYSETLSPENSLSSQFFNFWEVFFFFLQEVYCMDIIVYPWTLDHLLMINRVFSKLLPLWHSFSSSPSARQTQTLLLSWALTTWKEPAPVLPEDRQRKKWPKVTALFFCTSTAALKT